MGRINVVTCKLCNTDGQFLTLVDFWNPKGTIDIQIAPDSVDRTLMFVNGTQVAFGHPCTQFKVH